MSSLENVKQLKLMGFVPDPSLETFVSRFKEASEKTRSLANSFARNELDLVTSCEQMKNLGSRLGLSGSYFALTFSDVLSNLVVDPELSLQKVLEESKEIGIEPLGNFSQSTSRIKAISCVMQVLLLDNKDK